MSRFTRPDTRTLTISDGDTLVVRKRLSNGEQRAHFARLYARGPATKAEPGGTISVNAEQVGLALVTAYLLDWSLRDDDGTPVVIRDLPLEELERVLDNLTPDDFAEVHDAIELHVDAMRAEREAEKKNDDWIVGIISDLKLAIRCGWRYEWVRDLDADVHRVLVDEITRDLEQQQG